MSQIADNRFPVVMLLGGLSVNLNHLKISNTELNTDAIWHKNNDDKLLFTNFYCSEFCSISILKQRI